MNFVIDGYFYFKPGACQFPTVSIVGSNGKVSQCGHRTITEEEWKREPWFGKLAILSVVKLEYSQYRFGRRLWVYTRWGAAHFDFIIYKPKLAPKVIALETVEDPVA